jgi:branched-subunit amino acid aminotransferase/4-amino-4-deoxychorismate lyase
VSYNLAAASCFAQIICYVVSCDHDLVGCEFCCSVLLFQPSLGVATCRSALLYAILCPVGSYFSGEGEVAVSLLADPRFTRSWPGGCGDKKMGSNYAPTIHVQVITENGLLVFHRYESHL